jgi:glycine/D-amino acid oxidase-like deaminating enzyme
VDTTADVVVVGAGIFGASIAFRLTEADIGRVVLVDGRGPAGGNSGRTFSQVRRHYSNELTIRMANRGFETFRDWSDEVGMGDPGYEPLGYLLLVPPEAAEACRTNVALGQRLGVDTRFVHPDEIAALEPLLRLDDVAGGAYEPSGGVIDVYRMILSWVAAGQARGLVSRFGTAVRSIDASEGRTTGVTLADDTTISAPVVVNAAGAWGPALVRPLGVEVPVTFERLDMAWLRQHVGRPQIRLCVTDTAGGLVMRPDRGPVALAVAYGPDAGVAEPDTDDGVLPGYERRLRAVLADRVPDYADATWVRGTSGVYDATPDWHPILGWAPGIEGLYLALGWSGHGLKLAPAVGEIVADVVQGRAPFVDPFPLRPQRFAEGDLMRLAYGPGARA